MADEKEKLTIVMFSGSLDHALLPGPNHWRTSLGLHDAQFRHALNQAGFVQLAEPLEHTQGTDAAGDGLDVPIGRLPAHLLGDL